MKLKKWDDFLQLIRMDIDVQEHETLYNITLGRKLK
jgi:hypothetical protein